MSGIESQCSRNRVRQIRLLIVREQEHRTGTQALQSILSGEGDIACVPSVQLIQAVGHGVPVMAAA